MKQTIYILTIALTLSSCNNQTKQVDDTSAAKLDSTLNTHSPGSPNDTLQSSAQKNTSIVLASQQQPNRSSADNSESKDSLIFFDDSHFVDVGLVFKEISIGQYKDYEKNIKRTCSLDTNGFVSGKGLILEHSCKDICQSYLIDKKKGIKLTLPSGYDQGIIGLLISPSCNQFIVYSSYDSPDYTNYYEQRAELFGFSLAQGQGIHTVKPSFKIYSKDWSIEAVIWINNNEIALRTYEENKTINNETDLNYKYFKTKVSK